MKLEHISAMCPETGFAVQLQGFTPGFNVVYGANNTGKSSAWKIVRETFCPGSPAETDDAPLIGSVRVSRGGAQVIARPARQDTSGHYEILSRIGNPIQELTSEIDHWHRPAGRYVFFGRHAEEGELTRLLHAVQAEGIDLRGTETSAGGTSTQIERLLCPQLGPEELREEERRHQGQILGWHRADAEFHQRRAQYRAAWKHSIRHQEQTLQQISRLHELLLAWEKEQHQAQSRPAKLVSRPAASLPCEQTERLLARWRELLEVLETQEHRLQHAQIVSQDLQAQLNNLRQQLAALPREPEASGSLQEASQQLLAAMEQLLDRHAAALVPCTACGKVHAAQHEAHRSAIRQELTAQLAEFQRAAGVQEGSHCHCDLLDEQRQVKQHLAELDTWIDRLTTRRHQATEQLRLALSQEPAFQHGGSVCGCPWHQGALQEITCRTSRWMNFAFTPQPIAPVVEELIPAVSEAELARLSRRRQELQTQLAQAEDESRKGARLVDRHLRELQEFERTHHPSGQRQRLADNRARIDSLAHSRAQHDSVAEVIQKLRQLSTTGRMPPILAETSILLCRMTGGELRAVRLNAAGTSLEVLSRRGAWRPWRQLSAGAQRLVPLALRLVLAGEYRRQGWQFPLLLDDVLTENDQEWQQEAVAVLGETVEQGNQVILFTCQEHLARLCQSHGAHLQRLTRPVLPRSASTPAASAVTEISVTAVKEPLPITPPVVETPAVPRPVFDSHSDGPRERSVRVNRVVSDHNSSPPPASSAIVPYVERPFATEVADVAEEDRLADISLDDWVSVIPAVSRQKTRRLRRLGIHTVGDLLRSSAHDPRLLRGLSVESSTLERWQATARLLTEIPGLTRAEADVLAASGIHDARALAETDLDEFASRIQWLRFASRHRPAAALNLSRLKQLSQWAREPRRWNRTGEGIGAPRRSTARKRSARKNYESESSSGMRESAPRRRRARTARRVSEQPSGLRFRLSRTSPVVDAPSIGPKMARRLARLKIKFVSDLLNCDPLSLAAQFGDQQVKPETIRAWQTQARLICCIPEIHGHDAQLLAACGVDDPVRLAAQEPQALWRVIAEFSATAAGKRILRSGPVPDLEEVTAWITWARQARTLEAA